MSEGLGLIHPINGFPAFCMFYIWTLRCTNPSLVLLGVQLCHREEFAKGKFWGVPAWCLQTGDQFCVWYH